MLQCPEGPENTNAPPRFRLVAGRCRVGSIDREVQLPESQMRYIPARWVSRDGPTQDAITARKSWKVRDLGSVKLCSSSRPDLSFAGPHVYERRDARCLSLSCYPGFPAIQKSKTTRMSASSETPAASFLGPEEEGGLRIWRRRTDSRANYVRSSCSLEPGRRQSQ